MGKSVTLGTTPALTEAERLARAIEAELAERERATLAELAIRGDGLPEFCQLLWPVIEPRRPLVWSWHMDAVCRLLMDSYDDGERHEAVINIPPRHSKSSLVAVLGPAWRWLRHPEMQFLCITKAEKNAARDARLMRRVCQSPIYQQLLAMVGESWTFSEDQNRVSYYANSLGGHRISLTTSSDVTGAGADVLIIDDPHDARDLLGSPELVGARMEEVGARYEEVWTRRLNSPGGRVQLIMQRLHEADLAGRLLDDGARRLVLPFLAEPDHPDAWEDDPRTEGEILAPGRFGQRELEDARKNAQVWAGQMQQRPAPREGGLFQVAWFATRWRTLPELAQIVVSVDATFKGGKGSDFCVLGAFGRSRTAPAAAWLLDVRRARWDYPTLRASLRAFVDELRARYGALPLVVLVEDKANGSALIADLKAEIPAILPFEPGAKSKYERAQVGSVPMLEASQLLLPERADWVRDYIAEHTSFPAGRHDDQVDMTSQAAIYIAQHPLQAPGGYRSGGRRRDLTERGEGDEDRRSGRGSSGRSGRRGGW